MQFSRDSSGSVKVRKIATGETLTISSGFNESQTQYWVENVVFANGITWNYDALRAAAVIGGDAADTLYGHTSNDAMNGGAGNDTLYGNDGNDTLNGGAGIDTLIGGFGNDIYDVDGTGEVTMEALDQGTDVVRSPVSWVLGVNVESLILTGTAGLGGTGNALANGISGNAGNNTISGGDGNDWLDGAGGDDTVFGGSGNDSLYGGPGTDMLTGGTGNDFYHVDSAGDSTTELAGEGSDTVNASVDWTLAADVEALSLTGLAAISGTGNALGNTLIGNAAANALFGLDGNDTLNGGAGIDTLAGGMGNDVYDVDVVGDQTVEAPDQGVDTVRSLVSWARGDNVENLILAGTAAINGTGNALSNSFSGNAASNIINGGEGSDWIDGAGGDDVLDGGGAAADTLIGGTGADSYRLGRGFGVDSITESDLTAGVVDRVIYGAGIVQTDLRYARAANNLEVSIVNTADRLVVRDWYLGLAYQVEQFVFADNSTLSNAQVQALVGAMAGFAPSAAASTNDRVFNRQWTPADLLTPAM